MRYPQLVSHFLAYCQALVQQSLCISEISPLCDDHAKIAESTRNSITIARLPSEDHSLLQQCLRSFKISLFFRQNTQVDQHLCDILFVAQLLEDRQALF